MPEWSSGMPSIPMILARIKHRTFFAKILILESTGKFSFYLRQSFSLWILSTKSCNRLKSVNLNRAENTHHRGEVSLYGWPPWFDWIWFDWIWFDKTSKTIVHSTLANQPNPNKINRSAIKWYFPLSRCSLFRVNQQTSLKYYAATELLLTKRGLT